MEQIAAEGFVLLQNEDGAFPLYDVKNVNLFGWASTNPAYGGIGSGGINALFDVISLRQGLEDAGFAVNDELFSFYQGYTAERESMTIDKQSWTLPEPPVSLYTDELVNNAKNFSDVAIIVLSRAAGEGHNDLPVDVFTAAPSNLEMSAENMAKYHLNDNFDYTTYLNASDTMPTTGAKII